MTCRLCLTPIPLSRYGRTETLCEACLRDVIAEGDDEREAWLGDVEILRCEYAEPVIGLSNSSDTRRTGSATLPTGANFREDAA